MNSFRLRLVIVLAAAVVVLAACSDKNNEPEVLAENIARPAKIVPVISASKLLQRTFPGTLEASKDVELAFRVGGQLTALPVKPGVRVKKGELLAQLDETQYRNTLKQLQARYELAETQYGQMEKLLAQKLVSQLEYDQAAAELKSEQASLDQARDNLKYTRLLAPFDGIVAHVDVENYQAVQAQVPVIDFQDGDGLDIRISVPESVLNQFRAIRDPQEIGSICGQVHFVNNSDETIRACLKEREVNPDDLTRNYSVVFTLDRRPEFAVLPGMSASFTLILSPYLTTEVNEGLSVPVEAVFEQSNQKLVWRVDSEMRARLTEVEVGRIVGDLLSITDGLSSEDQVIAAGVSYVQEGMLVKPLVKERGL